MVDVTVQKSEDSTAKIRRRLAKLVKREIKVGVSEGTNRKGIDTPDEMGNAAKLYLNDNGAPEANIPQREVMRPGIERVRDDIVGALKRTAKAQLEDDERVVLQTMDEAGVHAQSGVRAEITDGAMEPTGRQLAEYTLKKRREAGFEGTDPLIVTGNMRRAITYVIDGEDRGAESDA